MQFHEFISQAWNDHAQDASAVAARFEQGLGLIQSAEEVPKLAHLISHVMGEHLGEFDHGRQWLVRLGDIPFNDKNSVESLRIYELSLRYASGDETGVSGLSDSDQARILAMAAGAMRDITCSESALRRADALAKGLKESDPAVRAIAVASNNLSARLQEMQNRSEVETQLMLNAAHIAREFWAKAGTWINIERAEYGLGQAYLQAGQVDQALHHAHECLRICRVNEAEAEEMKYAEDLVALISQRLSQRLSQPRL